MAQHAPTLDRDYDRVFIEYVRNLAREGRPSEESPPEPEVRTCAECGARAGFVPDLEGTWTRCSACGHLA